MAMYSFIPPFREAKFCGVMSCVSDKLGCAAAVKELRNTDLEPSLKMRGALSPLHRASSWHGGEAQGQLLF
jgi:hypothetical protein